MVEKHGEFADWRSRKENQMPATTVLRAYHGDPKIKAKYLRRVRAHRKADEILQGYGYWRDGKGCAVGCTLHSADHAAYETELGIPQALARLEDTLFERMSPSAAKDWPAQFLSAIRPGADLRMVVPKFIHWLLIDPQHGAIRFVYTARTKTAIERVAALYARLIAGGEITPSEWAATARAAEAAWAAAAEAAWAAEAAAWAAEAAAAEAAVATQAAQAAAGAAWAAEAAAWAAQAQKLLELLAEAEVLP